MNNQHLQSLLETYRNGLLHDILPFWMNHAPDHDFGGFITALNNDGSVVDTDKGVWQQGRFSWLLGELYNTVDKNPRWYELLEHGIQFLDDYCFDPEDGRMWFHLTQQGQPIRKRRYAFSESFAAIAYGEYAKATGYDEYATKAAVTFEGYLNHHLRAGKAQAKYTNTRVTTGLGFPMISIVTAQQLRDSIGLDTAEHWIDRSIETIEQLHVKDDLQVVMETVGADGAIIDHFDGRMLNPGHAIEGAWFIMNEGKHRKDSQLIELGLKMLDYMFERGWDKKYGGVLYFTDLNNLPVQEYWHDMKFWWPQNETIIATLLAYQLTRDEKYAEMHRLVHDWAYKHFPDREYGEWFGYLHRDGGVSSTLKGNLWKGPFHIPRMKLECWRIVEEMMNEADAD